MKIGIISDTHCGDWNAPFSLTKLAPVKARIVGIFGNVDGERDFMKVKAKELGAEYDIAILDTENMNVEVIEF